MLSVADALARVVPSFLPCGTVRVPLAGALGLFLAGDVLAREDLPAFDNSAMDGYAVRARDLAGPAPVTLPVRGESRAGGGVPPPLEPGSAMRIFTGAPLPAGADAIVMQEDTQRTGEAVSVRVAPAPGAHVRPRASDLRAGALLLAAGTRLGPGELGLLASQRYGAVSVGRPPRVAILSTGDELRDVSDPPEPGTIVDSNAYALAAQVTEAGGVPWVLPVARDRRADLEAHIAEGLRADVLLSVGGVSVGDYDLVKEAFAAQGVRQDFWRVAIKPGKPLSFGLAGRVPVVGLPGNPASAMVTFEVFVRPGLRRMLGDPRPYRGCVEVELADAVAHRPGRTELVRAALARTGGRLLARPLALQGSGSLPSMVGVDALVVVPAERGDVARGDRLPALLAAGDPGSGESPFGP